MDSECGGNFIPDATKQRNQLFLRQLKEDRAVFQLFTDREWYLASVIAMQLEVTAARNPHRRRMIARSMDLAAVQLRRTTE